MSSQFKVINQSNTGTATKFGGNDLDKTHNLLNGQSGYFPITIRSLFGFEDGKFFIEYPTTGKRVYIRTGSLSEDQDWFLPIGTGWITNTLKNLFVNEQSFEKFIMFKKISAPANPAADHLTLWADSTTGQIMVKDSTGVAQTIFADIANVANFGTTGVSLYDSKVSNTVYLRSLTSLSSALTAAHNATTHSVDLTLDPSEILLETLGGTLLSSQVPVLGTGNLPAKVVLDDEATTFTELIKFDKNVEMKLQTSHPTPSSGYVSFYPKDDGKLYFKNSTGSVFTLLYDTDLGNTAPLPPAGYVSGHWDGTGLQGTGLLNNMQEYQDITRADYHDLTTGKFGQEWGSDTDNSACGLASVKTTVAYRDANPTLTVGFSIDTGGVPAQSFLGFTSSIAENKFDNDNTLNSAHGFGIIKRSADTTWNCVRNDGAATQTVDNTGGLPTVDTGFHTLKIVGDNDNDRWGLSWDGGSMTWKTNNDPIEERELGIAFTICADSASTNIRKIRIFSVTLTRKHL